MPVFIRVVALLMAVAAIGSPALADDKTRPRSPDTAGHDTVWRHAADTWRLGRLDLYVPFLTYHPPFAYSLESRRAFNEFPAGGGIGMGRYNGSGNWEGLCAMEFADSHGKPEYLAAYLWIPTWHPFTDELRIGAGLAGGITARSDIGRYTPFPGVLPVASLGYGKLDVQATYVPGFKHEGNVLFCWTKLSFY